MKDLRADKPKSKPQKSKAIASQRFIESAETFKKAWKEKKKKDQKSKRDCQEQKSSTPATKVNNISAGRSRPQKDVIQVTYFNCNKKGDNGNKCPKPPKPNH